MISTYSATNLEAAYAAGKRSFENEDFSNKDLRGLSIVDTTFVNCNFENSVLDYAILNGCKFIYCNLKFAHFEEADLSDCLIEECDFEDTLFVCANLIGTKFEGVNKYKADFQGALFEEKCYIDTHDGVPVSGQISTEQEYLEALEDTPDFCGRWREFSSRKEAQDYIDNFHSNVEGDDESIINVIYGNIEGTTLNGWSSEPSDIYDTPISVTYSHYEECDDSGSPDHKGWNVYNSAYGEVYICV